jgi:hypothetical protein
MVMGVKVCENCNGTNDVADFFIGKQEHVLCVDCRVKLLPTRGKQMTTQKQGRPSLGITKKMSVTLPEGTWDLFDKLAGNNISMYLRGLINRDMFSDGDWSNNACLGYAILGAQRLGYSEEQIKQLVRSINGQFDSKSVEEAKEVYNQSPY